MMTFLSIPPSSLYLSTFSPSMLPIIIMITTVTRPSNPTRGPSTKKTLHTLLLTYTTAPTLARADDTPPPSSSPTDDEDDDDDDDILTEMMAEEKIEREELDQLEAEMRELEALKAQRRRQQEQNGGASSANPGGAHPNKPGTMDDLPGARTGRFDTLDAELRKKEAAAAEVRRLASVQANEEDEGRAMDDVAAKREAAFQAEVKRAGDDRKRRQALERQKARDARVVSRLLKRSKVGRHYAVLGFTLCQWGEVRVVGRWWVCRKGAAEIKRAWREVARKVHPDKNRDGRAVEAFRALEGSAELLLDKGRRKEYDTRLRVERREAVEGATRVIETTVRSACETARMVRRILGPLFLPVVTLLLIII